MSSAFIQVDKPFYFAGDTIQGHIFLNLVEVINANQILVKFKGWESVRWIEERVLTEQEKQGIQNNLIWHNSYRVHMESSDSSDHPGEEESMRYNYVRNGNQIIEIKRYAGGRVISRLAHVLYSFGGKFIPPGQYSFPFSFKTGEDYPASFMDKSSDNKSKGRIKYEMQAFIRGFNTRLRIVKCKTQIVIRQTTAIKNDKQEMQAHVTSCCCCDQGTTRIRCFFEKNAYSPGEDAKMYCVVDNKQGKSQVQNVSVTLKNEITYVSRENHQKSRVYNIFENRFPGLQPGQEGEREQIVKMVNQTNKLNPMDIKPTARGQNLKSIYYLQVQAVLSASCTCCSDLPVVKQPILIYPWMPVNFQFQAPSNWHPEEMQMANLKMGMEMSNPNLNNMNNPYP